METIKELQALLDKYAKEKFTAEFVIDAAPEERNHKALGCLLAQYCDHVGTDVLKVASLALIDANFGKEATLLDDIIGQIEDEANPYDPDDWDDDDDWDDYNEPDDFDPDGDDDDDDDDEPYGGENIRLWDPNEPSGDPMMQLIHSETYRIWSQQQADFGDTRFLIDDEGMDSDPFRTALDEY